MPGKQKQHDLISVMDNIARFFLPGSNRAKYCPDCASRMKRRHAAERKRKQRRGCHALGTEKTL